MNVDQKVYSAMLDVANAARRVVYDDELGALSDLLESVEELDARGWPEPGELWPVTP